MTATAGVTALTRLLQGAAEGGPVPVSDLAARAGVPRSSAYEIVAKLVAAGFLIRLPQACVGIGPEATRLAFASAGLVRLAGPARPVLGWLAEETAVAARLTTAQGVPLLVQPRGFAGPAAFRRAVGPPEVPRAWLELAPGPLPPDRADAALARAALTLETHLGENHD